MLAHFPRVEFLTEIKKILSCISAKCVIKKFQVVVVQSNQEIYFGPVPKRPIRIKILVRFCIYPSCVLLKVAFCVIIMVSQSQGSTLFCKLELHFIRQENLA